MNREEIIEKTIDFVKQTLTAAEGGHDWWHVYRVWGLSKKIALTESADLFVVELGALLHDIADAKFFNGDEEVGPRLAREWLVSVSVDQKIVEHVENIIRNISFKGGGCEQKFKSLELDVVQDADRLDALGAIGVARAFNYGGHKGRAIYNPEIKPRDEMTKEEYLNGENTSINHFYEKLLLLKDLMNTATGRALAEQRHNFIEAYLEEFYKEWHSAA